MSQLQDLRKVSGTHREMVVREAFKDLLKGWARSRRPELEIADEKLAFLDQAKLRDIAFDEIRPDAKYNWINLAQNDFESLVPTATVKPGQRKRFLSFSRSA